MHIDFVDSTTVKEIKLQSEWYAKQSKKLMRIFRAEFSKQERHRAETCTAGKATKLLSSFAFNYLSLSVNDDREESILISIRPSTETLLKNSGSLFSSDKPYYNKYFASWWYKKNWETLVKIYLGE